MNKLVSLAIASLIFSIILGISLLIDFFNDRTSNKLLISFSIILFLVGITYLFLGIKINKK
ncbi:hypothetical protein [Rummeliibacillus suwonensis]|uniref:hypothetical protein n=1 Tax=Rummeliibacillus suwonensis TaxID=1306154 RepID=UPI00289ED36F|nr:hypothetical protein [Rummeliibacillus suwonensis]